MTFYSLQDPQEPDRPTGVKQVKNKTIKFFKLRYKAKKNSDSNGWSIDIPKQAIKQIDNKTVYIYKKVTKEEKFVLKEVLDFDIQHDCKVHFDVACTLYKKQKGKSPGWDYEFRSRCKDFSYRCR